MIAANRAVGSLMEGIAPHLLESPVNVLRLSMQPEGLASRIVNIGEFGAFLVDRLRHEIGVSGDPVLMDLLVEIGSYRVAHGGKSGTATSALRGIAVPFQVRTEREFYDILPILSFFNTTTVFGTATDVTVSELAIESFFPADQPTADAMVRLMAEADDMPPRETLHGE